MLNFSVPMVAIYRNRSLREEPMPLLVFNLALADFGFGFSLFLIGTLDVVFSENAPLPACASFQYVGIASVLTFKAATVYLAVDQFVAIVHSLHYHVIMQEWVRRMFFLTWCWMPIYTLYGFVCYQLEMETLQEYDQRTIGSQGSVKECRFPKTAFVTMMFFEASKLLMSIISAALFIYTAIKGLRQERRNSRRGQVDETSQFFLRFKSFKRIVKVLLILLTLDILDNLFRIGSRMLPQMPVFQLGNLLRMLSVIVEGWTYGLSYPAIRSAIVELFRRRDRGRPAIRRRPAVRRPRRVDTEWPERDIESRLRF